MSIYKRNPYDIDQLLPLTGIKTEIHPQAATPLDKNRHIFF